MSLLDLLIILVAVLVMVFVHTPLAITVIVTLAVIIFARWLLGERIPRRPAQP